MMRHPSLPGARMGDRKLDTRAFWPLPSRAGEKTYVRSWRGGQAGPWSGALLGRSEFARAIYTYLLTELRLMLIAAAPFRRRRRGVIVPAA